MFSKNYRTLIFNIIACLFIILLVVFYFNFKIIVVKGSSMLPTYHDKQILIAKRDTDNIISNNIIIFHDNTNTLCIKRVIAKPGDTVSMKKNNIKVNGCSIKDVQYSGEDKIYKLNEDEYYVIGDNWRNSCDSREYGPIHLEQIQGIVL